MGWKEDYQRKYVSAEEAVKVVKSGDGVGMGQGPEPRSLVAALMARRHQLKSVKLYVGTTTRHFEWYQPGWEDAFQIVVGLVTPVTQQICDERRCDFAVNARGFVPEVLAGDYHPPAEFDVLLTEVGPPNEHGYCSFGAARLNRKELVRSSRTVLAEVNERYIRTYGDNHVHISEIDYFVKHIHTGAMPGQRGLRGGAAEESLERVRPFAEYISPLIKDGDTVQIGVGSVTEPLPRVGLLDGKHDLGWHSEATPRGIARLVREGVITGKYKTMHRGKVVATSVGGSTMEDLEFCHDNPMVELYSMDYIDNPIVIAQHDNMVAINQILAIDLTGQIASVSLGPRLMSGTGGQLGFAVGTALSRGGRSLMLLPSTARGGTVSRIVAQLEPGTQVTVPNTLADYIVTEYGIARLKGKPQRERAEALIALAHPDFRVELKKAAARLFWP
jgi:4-hydroxybutyrate CoA-transferase